MFFRRRTDLKTYKKLGGAYGSRTRVNGLKGRCPWPLDESPIEMVGCDGIEPPHVHVHRFTVGSLTVRPTPHL